tara:strand:+ start:445 stop:1035 length:591 start_codon:yes stop_codon:yes gene_type:complete
MSGIATAIAGSAIVGGIASNRATDKSIRASEQAGDRASQQLQEATGQARQDLFQLFPASQQNMQQGFQGALNVFNQALPQQAQTFQNGNVAAQNQLLAGMPQFQNAILGGPVDNSQFQATRLQQPNFNFANQQLQSFDPFAVPQQSQANQVMANQNMANQQRSDAFANNMAQFPMNSNQTSGGAFNVNDLLMRGFR